MPKAIVPREYNRYSGLQIDGGSQMKIEIQGQDAIAATEELLAIEGVSGSYETLDEVEREGTLTTIATIVGIVGGSLTVAEKLYQVHQKYQKSLQGNTTPRIEKVMIVADNGKRLLLKNATVEQIQEILKN
jgi:hypothetical protein